MGGVGLIAGQVVWCDLDPSIGRDQGGRRPCVVVSSEKFSAATDDLVIAVPCTSRDRGWVHHIPLSGPTGLTRKTFAITEQPRTMSVDRIRGHAGHVDEDCMSGIVRWVHVWQQSAG